LGGEKNPLDLVNFSLSIRLWLEGEKASREKQQEDMEGLAGLDV